MSARPQYDEIGPRCRCGLYLLGDRCPYCECNRVGFTGETSPTKRTRAQMREDAEIRLAETRRLKVQEVEEQLRVAGVGQGGSIEGDASLRRLRGAPSSLVRNDGERADIAQSSDLDSHPSRPKHKQPRAPRRTKADMEAIRATKEKELADIAALVTPAWLTEPDPMLESLLTGEDVE